jgi:hypothetical protein
MIRTACRSAGGWRRVILLLLLIVAVTAATTMDGGTDDGMEVDWGRGQQQQQQQQQHLLRRPPNVIAAVTNALQSSMAALEDNRVAIQSNVTVVLKHLLAEASGVELAVEGDAFIKKSIALSLDGLQYNIGPPSILFSPDSLVCLVCLPAKNSLSLAWFACLLTQR